jgi:hypothetical protein
MNSTQQQEQAVIAQVAAAINAEQAEVEALLHQQALMFVDEEEAAAAQTVMTGAHTVAESGRRWFEFECTDADDVRRRYWASKLPEGPYGYEVVRIEDSSQHLY